MNKILAAPSYVTGDAHWDCFRDNSAVGALISAKVLTSHISSSATYYYGAPEALIMGPSASGAFIGEAIGEKFHGVYSILGQAIIGAPVEVGFISDELEGSREMFNTITRHVNTSAMPRAASISTSDLAFAGIKQKLSAWRNSEDDETFIFAELLPVIEEHGRELLRLIDASIKNHELHPLTRRNFAYMLSYLGGPLQQSASDFLQLYRVSDDRWLSSGAEEGFERLASR